MSKWRSGCSFFDPEMSFSRPRDWSILFSAAARLFFDLQLFFSPAMRPRKRAQSFSQLLCIILSSLFLGPETSCSEPRIFFRTPRHLFLDLRCFFLTSAGETHTQGSLSYAAASRLLQRSSCLELIQNRKDVEPTASDQKRKIDKAQSPRTQRSSAL